MLLQKTYQYRLSPTPEQNNILHEHGSHIRYVWNKLLEYSKQIKKDTGKYPNRSKVQSQLILIKNDHSFLKLTHSQPLQINCKRLSEAYTKTFSKETKKKRNEKIAKAMLITDPILRVRRLAKAFNYGFPNFKSKHTCSDSIYYPQNFKVDNNVISLAKIGSIKFIKHRPIEGKVKTSSINQDGSHWYLSLVCEVEKEIIKKPLEEAIPNIIGIDMGINHFATLSDGRKISNPQTLKKYQKRLIHEQKALSRKELKENVVEENGEQKIFKKSSKNRLKQLKKVQILNRKVRNIRKDFLHNVSHDMIAKYDGICVETLDIESMLKENKLKGKRESNQNITDASWYEFIRMSKYKAEWEGKWFKNIDKYFPSTQTCHICNNVKTADDKLKLWDREYICEICKGIFDRDDNGSMTIKDEGIRLLRNENLYRCNDGKCLWTDRESGLDEAEKVVILETKSQASTF